MEQSSFEILEKFYKKLYANVLRNEKKLVHDSVLLTLIKIIRNKTSKLLNDSSITLMAFSFNDLKTLKEAGYIRRSDDNNKLDEYILTAHGLWEVEKKKKVIDENKIVDYLQNKYFSFSVTNKPLKTIEKMTLLAMIGARTFSSDSPMNLSKQSVCDHWLEIYKEAYQFLQIRHIIKKRDLTFEKKGNEHPVLYEMRRANDLPQKTHHIFRHKGNNQYYLDVLESSGLSEPKIHYLLKLIFGKIENLTMVEEIQKFCESIAYGKSKFVKDDFKFIKSKFDMKIKDALTQLYLD